MLPRALSLLRDATPAPQRESRDLTICITGDLWKDWGSQLGGWLKSWWSEMIR